MNKRTMKALEVLRNGGKIHYHSDTDLRLRDAEGNVVKGFGLSTLNALLSAGMLKAEQVSSQTVYTSMYF